MKADWSEAEMFSASRATSLMESSMAQEKDRDKFKWECDTTNEGHRPVALIKYYAMKTYGESGDIGPLFLTSALDVGIGQLQAPNALLPEKIAQYPRDRKLDGPP
jgi:hypothetical protein